MIRVCHAFLSVHCNLVVTCWEGANLSALLYVMFACVFVTFKCGVLGQVWYLVVWISDLCLLAYFACVLVVTFISLTYWSVLLICMCPNCDYSSR